jgi:hypothetical protein
MRQREKNKTIPGMGSRGDKGEHCRVEFKYDIFDIL